jgi:autotransporter-associated beta strand protein
MRKATLAALVGASALVVGVQFSSADTLLFGTEADFGGSQYAPGGSSPATSPYRIVQNPNPVPNGQIKQTNWLGLGFYSNSVTGAGGGAVSTLDSAGDTLTYPATSLGTVNNTSNGVGNLDNYNPATGTNKTPDANLGISYAGLTSPTGSIVVQGYEGSYDTITTGEMITDLPGTSTESPASVAFINALTTGTCMAYDITAPGGGTTASTTYYETTFETADNNPSPTGNNGFNNHGFMQANLTTTLTSRDKNEYTNGNDGNLDVGNDDPGSFAVAHGTGASSYWTVYIPYAFAANYASTLTFLQFVIELNSGGDQIGNVTIDNIRTVSPTWAGAVSPNGTVPSWNLVSVVNYNNPDGAPDGTPSNGVLTQTGNWVGGPGGYGAPNGSGASATFADLSGGNTQVGLDTVQTLGTLNFNALQIQYTLVPSSTGSSTSGSLVMDNTVNSADAAINDIAGGQASTNYTEFVAVPVALNSNTDVTVTRSTDILDITGNISGTGALTMMAGSAGTLQLYGNNTYSGGTVVNGGTVLVSSTGALPANKPVTVNGGVLQLASTIAGNNLAITGLSITGHGKVQVADNATAGSVLGTRNVTLTSLSITGNGVLDIGNNRIIVDYSSPATDPIASIAAWIHNGFYGLPGPAITSSDIAADDAASGHSYGIGYADGADGAIAGLPSGEIEIMFTLLGDANLDGTVNSEDFTPFSTNLGLSGGWDKGDFNYDGTINAEDFTPFSSNLGQSATLAAAAGVLEANGSIELVAVPEPASMGLLVVAGLGVLARRRRTVRQ